MPAQVALFIFAAFVWFLLKLDRKQTPNVSKVLWIPTIWVLSIAGKPMATWFSSPGVDAESGSPMDQLFHSGILCVGLFILSRRRLNWANIIRENTWLFVLLGFMLISVAWSEIPFTSFKRWVRELGAVTMAFLVLSEKDPRQAAESLLRRTVAIFIPASVLCVKYYPNFGVWYSRWTGEIQWVGIAMQKNGLGRLCLIAGFFIIWGMVRRRKGRAKSVHKYQTHADVLLLLMTAWLLRGPSIWAASATAVYSLIVGLLTWAVLAWVKKHRIVLPQGAVVAGVACIIALGVIQPLTGGSAVGSFTGAMGRNSTLTGRTEIWASLIPDVMGRFLLGAGFGGFWTSDNRISHDISEAHNGYLEVWLGLGIVGLALTITFLLAHCKKAARALAVDHDWASLCICFLVMACIHNISESSFDSFTRHLAAQVLFLAVSLTGLRRVVESKESIPKGAESQSSTGPAAAGA